MSGPAAHGIAVVLTVLAGFGLALLVVFVVFGNGYECPTMASPGSAATTVTAVRSWWPLRMVCVAGEGSTQVSPSDWGLTVMVLLGLLSAVVSIPFWATYLRKK